ncbi:MAG: hypothetical protein AAGH41_11515 [Pseudomonadota bacterium]
MAKSMTAARVRVTLAELVYKKEIELADIYAALGVDPQDADPEAVAHLAGIIDGMAAAAKAIRDQGLEGWSKPS